jgi:hypothetical protein
MNFPAASGVRCILLPFIAVSAVTGENAECPASSPDFLFGLPY